MIVVILGKSNSGKTTLFKEAFTNRYKKIVTMTTRPKRLNEVEGQDYYFTDNKNFELLKKNNEIIAPRTFINADGDHWSYGIPSSLIKIEERQIIILDPAGFKSLKESLINSNKKVTSIFINCPDSIRIKRGVKRGDDPNEILRRVEADSIDFAGLEEQTDFTIDNYYHDDPDVPVEQLETLLKSLF